MYDIYIYKGKEKRQNVAQFPSKSECISYLLVLDMLPMDDKDEWFSDIFGMVLAKIAKKTTDKLVG